MSCNSEASCRLNMRYQNNLFMFNYSPSIYAIKIHSSTSDLYVLDAFIILLEVLCSPFRVENNAKYDTLFNIIINIIIEVNHDSTFN